MSDVNKTQAPLPTHTLRAPSDQIIVWEWLDVKRHRLMAHRNHFLVSRDLPVKFHVASQFIDHAFDAADSSIAKPDGSVNERNVVILYQFSEDIKRTELDAIQSEPLMARFLRGNILLDTFR